jgi:hypothetical protein
VKEKLDFQSTRCFVIEYRITSLPLNDQEAREKGFGKRHEEYKTKWEMNKRMRGMMAPRGFG